MTNNQVRHHFARARHRMPCGCGQSQQCTGRPVTWIDPGDTGGFRHQPFSRRAEKAKGAVIAARPRDEDMLTHAETTVRTSLNHFTRSLGDVIPTRSSVNAPGEESMTALVSNHFSPSRTRVIDPGICDILSTSV